MSLVLTEDQQILKQSAADFVKKESPVSRFRSLRDNVGATGFSRDVWAKMAQLGWPAIVVPEQYGGLSMGALELACVMEECGRKSSSGQPTGSQLSLSTAYSIPHPGGREIP